MTLPIISSQMEVGRLGGWPGAAGTLEHCLCNIPTPCLDTSSSQLVAGIPHHEWQSCLHPHICLLFGMLQAAPWKNIFFTGLLLVFFFLFWVEPWEPAILRHTAQSTVPCLLLLSMCQISQQVVTSSCNPCAWEIDASLLLLPHGMGEHDGERKSCCHWWSFLGDILCYSAQLPAQGSS